MCGIFGLISKHTIEPAAFHQIGEQNTVRGNRAFGVLTISAADGSPGVVKRVTPFDAAQVALQNVSIALGHVRAPTDGRADDPAAVHPFQTNDLWLAHNGLLLNHEAYAHWRPIGAAKIDSTVIIGGIQRQIEAGRPIIEAIQHTVEPLDGQQACWLWHMPSRLLYLWRVMSPIYSTQTPELLTFSSIRGALSDQLLAEGTIYQIDPTAIGLSAVGTFAYRNPFRVTT